MNAAIEGERSPFKGIQGEQDKLLNCLGYSGNVAAVPSVPSIFPTVDNSAQKGAADLGSLFLPIHFRGEQGGTGEQVKVSAGLHVPSMLDLWGTGGGTDRPRMPTWAASTLVASTSSLTEGRSSSILRLDATTKDSQGRKVWIAPPLISGTEFDEVARNELSMQQGFAA